MSNEIKSLEINNTWKLVDLPKYKTPSGTSECIKLKEEQMKILKGTKHVSGKRLHT